MILPYDTDPIPERLQEFRKYLLATRSKSSVHSYFTWLKRFERFLEKKNIDISEANLLILQEFINDLIDQNYKPNTIEVACNALKKYSKWLHKKKVITEQFENPETPQRTFVKKFSPTKEQVEIIAEYVETLEEPYKTIILLFPLLGMRIGELTNIRLKDIRRELNKKKNKMQTIITTIGKGKKLREIPLSDGTNQIIVNYLKNYRSNINSPWLFPNRNNKSEHVKSENLQKIIRKLRDDLNLPELTSHAFRRFFASILSNKNIPLADIATLLGHTDIKTTFRYYINPNQQDLMDAIEKLDK